jgi:hypothetical protein
MRNMIVTLLCILMVPLGGCSMEKWGGPTTPGTTNTSIGGGTVSALSLVTGTWTGSETASVGLSGPLSVTFTQAPTPDAHVAGSITVTLSTGTFSGTFSGTVSSIDLVATAGPAGVCNYHAIGTLNEAGTQMTGTYTGSGTGPNCDNKAGTFVLNGQSATCSTTYWQMNQGTTGAAKNKCENTYGGTYLGATLGHTQVCMFSPHPPGAPGEDMTLFQTTPIVCPVLIGSLR